MERKDNILIELNRVNLMDSDTNNRILQDISMEVKAGEKKLILSRPYNPATYLLKLCATQYPPTSGTISVFGKVINEMRFNDLLLIKRNIGFVDRDSSLISNKSLFENITLGLRYHNNISISEARSHAQPYIVHFDLLENINDRPARIPHEKLRMALFCRELIQAPSLMILEKPSHGLSRDELKFLMEAILSYQKESNCGLIVSDDDVDFFGHTFDFAIQELIDGCLSS